MNELISKTLEILPEESEYRKFVEKTIAIHHEYQEWRDARKELMKQWHVVRKQLRQSAI